MSLFRECYTAFLYLRRHANLILNLFGLMVDANVPDIALEPDKTVKKVQVNMHRFVLMSLTDAFCSKWFLPDIYYIFSYPKSIFDPSKRCHMRFVFQRTHSFCQYVSHTVKCSQIKCINK